MLEPSHCFWPCLVGSAVINALLFGLRFLEVLKLIHAKGVYAR